jgi:hypothetical protein
MKSEFFYNVKAVIVYYCEKGRKIFKTVNHEREPLEHSKNLAKQGGWKLV